MSRWLPTLALLALAACSQEPATDPAGSAPAPTASPAIASAETPPPASVRAYRYMPLDGCELVREERAEMPYREVRCAGPGRWALRISDSDARQLLAVIAPDGTETRLDLLRVSGGAFNSFIGTAEWRGPAREPFAPDAVIVRFSVAEEPYPAPETAFLLAIRLAPAPCLVAQVRPGPRQNDSARAAADGSGPCIAAT